MSSLTVLVGAAGLAVGDELSFFYPSTEWDMAQGFSCFCGAATCRGLIRGAKSMSAADLEGVWLNAHIRQLLEERDASSNGTVVADGTEEALKASLLQARKMLDVAQRALDSYVLVHRENGVVGKGLNGEKGGDARRGVTSREMSGEMGGDTFVSA